MPELFCFELFSVLCRLHPRGRDVFVNGDSFIPNVRALVRLVEVIGEAASRFPEEFRSRYNVFLQSVSKTSTSIKMKNYNHLSFVLFPR